VEVDEAAAEINVVWRADLDESLFLAAAAGHDPALATLVEDEVSDRLDLCPPSSGEALALPLSAVRRWLGRSSQSDDLSDVPGKPVGPPDGTSVGAQRWVLRWRRSSSKFIPGSDLRPGDTIVVPSTRGGITDGTWDPTAHEIVEDLALPAGLQRGRAVISLQPKFLPQRRYDPDVEAVQPFAFEAPDLLESLPAPERRALLKEDLELLARTVVDSTLAEALGHISSAFRPPRLLIDGLADGEPSRSYVVAAALPWVRGLSASDADGAATLETEDDGEDRLSFTGAREVTLRRHLAGVGYWASSIGFNLGLPAPLLHDLTLAGRLHDAGKVDPRFQAWLRGTDPATAADSSEPLAKSTNGATDRAGRQAARQRSGYPRGARHELLSFAMVGGADDLEATDQGLVRYLVLSHHGFGRYRFDPIVDSAKFSVSLDAEGMNLTARTDHGLERLDRGVPELFWDMTRTYGWYGLAWLESMLRLADHHRSRLEQEGIRPEFEHLIEGEEIR
jgi:CRISPR-associated endonuclease/helicase Cas3